MGREEFVFTSSDGIDITYYKWNNVKEKVKGIVLILHGMAEHALRYDDFAKFLNANNYIVYACDHRGHGKTGENMQALGSFGQGGWKRVVDDIYELSTIIKFEYKDLPLYLFGHSMGSLLARTALIEYGTKFDGVILSGTTNASNFINRNMGLLVCNIIVEVIGKDAKSNILDKLFFGSNNKDFKGENMKFAWLSRDDKKVLEYQEDRLCGFICTSSFYLELIKGVKGVVGKNSLRDIPIGMPMFILSGEKDPASNSCKDVLKLYKGLKSVGIEKIDLKIYQDGRHEMLNEINRSEVYNDIEKWISNVSQQ